MNSNLAGDLPSVSTTLLDQIQHLHTDSWNRLVETFSPIVYGWCRDSGLNTHDSADVVQEVFGSIAKGIANFQRQKESGSFRSWLATISRNKIRDFVRGAAKRPTAMGGSEFLHRVHEVATHPKTLAELEESCSEAALNQRLPQRVMELVKREVESHTWQAFWLSTVEEVPPQLIAEQLEISVASVYQAKSRVLRRIRRRLEELP